MESIQIIELIASLLVVIVIIISVIRYFMKIDKSKEVNEIKKELSKVSARLMELEKDNSAKTAQIDLLLNEKYRKYEQGGK